MKLINESNKLILIASAALLSIVIIIIVMIAFISGNGKRTVFISEFTGTLSVLRDGAGITISPKMKLKSGDTIVTGEDSTARISIDGDKYVAFEPNTTAYIIYDGSPKKGNISVNLTNGAVISQLNKPLPAKSVFAVKTPNSVVSAKGTVFRVQFQFTPEYLKYKNASITTAQNLEGSVAIQLYNANAEPVESSMVLLPKTYAQMVTGDNIAEFISLNQDFDINSFDYYTLKEIIRVKGERSLPYAIEDLNSALFLASNEYINKKNALKEQESQTVTTPPVEEIVTTTTSYMQTNIVTATEPYNTTTTRATTTTIETTATSPESEDTANTVVNSDNVSDSDTQINTIITMSETEGTTTESGYISVTLPIPPPVTTTTNVFYDGSEAVSTPSSILTTAETTSAEETSVVDYFGDVSGLIN